jgi:transmembrane sensor
MTGVGTTVVDEARLEAASAWCIALSDGELSAAQRTRFTDWLETDAANRVAFETVAELWDGVAEISISPATLSLRRDALAAFEHRRRNRRRLPSPQRLGPIAAVLLVGFLLSVGGAWWVSRPDVLETGTGERRVIVLSDGSTVSLDAASRVRVRYSGHQRRLWLDRGRAKFGVAHDTDRPFTVAAAGRLVRATGTQFSVELLGGGVHVVLYEGRVTVRSIETSQPSGASQPSQEPSGTQTAEAVLTPGQELTSVTEAQAPTVATIDTVRSLAWEGGQLIFVDEPLASAVERVNRYSPTRLVVDDAATANVRVDAVLAAGDTEAFIEGVTGLYPVRALRTPGAVHLASKETEP